MAYENQDFKIPMQSADYAACSDFVIASIDAIVSDSIASGKNKIVINTNLKFGLPMENINKLAGPFIEAWAVETFHTAMEEGDYQFSLINVESLERLHMADVILQFKKRRKNESSVTANVDVKATAEDIKSSGKSPNITSFARIRTAYVDDPDYIFIILSLKHRVYKSRNKNTGLVDGTMEVVAFNTYDLKFISWKDLNYNPALGTGQIQIRDIHYVDIEKRSTWQFCQILDQKYLLSSRRSFEQWLELAIKHSWIKIDA